MNVCVAHIEGGEVGAVLMTSFLVLRSCTYRNSTLNLIANTPLLILRSHYVPQITGTIDESIRHSITKLSHLHFVCTEEVDLG